MSDTLCWRCSREYDPRQTECPHCGAANGNHDLEKAQAAALPERSPTEKEEAEVLALAEDYGQWMWDSGYMDNPTGETLVDEAAAKREEIAKALNSVLVSAYADGRRDEREEIDVAGLLAAVRDLPSVNASEIDGEESDGTPRHYRNRRFVSLTKLERLLRERLK